MANILSSHAYVKQLGDTLIITLPTATLRIPLPKMVSVYGMVETVQVSGALQEERQVDLVAQRGRFEIRDIDHNLLFDYQETGTDIESRLQPAAQIVERSTNASVIDLLSEQPTEEHQGHRLESVGSINNRINRQQQAATSPQGPAHSLFLGNNPSTPNVNKRKMTSESPSDIAQTPEHKRRVSSLPLVPLENVDRKVMLVTERLKRRTLSQDTTPRFIAAAPRARGSSASAVMGIRPTAFTKISPKKKTTAKGTHSTLPCAPSSGTPYRTSPTANAGTNGVATNKKASNNIEVASTKPKGFNSVERVFGTQALQTKWKGMAHYNCTNQRTGSGEQISLNVDENIRPRSRHAETSPKAKRGTSSKEVGKLEETRSVVGKESVPKPHDTGAKKTHAASSAGRRQRTEELPTRLLKENAGIPASAHLKSGGCHSVLKGRKDQVSHRDGEMCLGNGMGSGSETEDHVPRISPVKCNGYRTRHDGEENATKLTSLRSKVSTIRHSTSLDTEGENYGFPCALPTSHMDRSRPCATDVSPARSASARKAPPAPIPPADDLPYGFLQYPDGSILKMTGP
ncbi:MAG: hypothetical protein LQ346_004038 [Caloplaca aetnensis]|nr:MAG: hypothetical protein LQ346_004038 [Caloplaca aetnensis]